MNESGQQQYWQRIYAEFHQRHENWMDYASEAEQTFTFGAALTVAGAVEGKRCLDIGCGKGGFARLVHALGGKVIALDMIETTISELRARVPFIQWETGNVSDAVVMSAFGTFDVVFAIEVLQCVPSKPFLENAWACVSSGGRLVGVVPNADNPFVQQHIKELPGLYSPLGAIALKEQLSALPDVADWGLIGFKWRSDRSSVLYDLLPLTREPTWEEPPKRLLFLARKS